MKAPNRFHTQNKNRFFFTFIPNLGHYTNNFLIKHSKTHCKFYSKNRTDHFYLIKFCENKKKLVGTTITQVKINLKRKEILKLLTKFTHINERVNIFWFGSKRN